MTNVDLATPQNLRAKRGRKFEVVFGCEFEDQPIDLTGYSAQACVRPYADATSILATFEVSIDAGTGEIWLALPASEVSKIKRDGYYDVKLVAPAGEPIDFIEGKFSVKGRVTA